MIVVLLLLVMYEAVELLYLSLLFIHTRAAGFRKSFQASLEAPRAFCN